MVKPQLKPAIARTWRLRTAQGETHRKLRASQGHVVPRFAGWRVEQLGPGAESRVRGEDLLVERDRVEFRFNV